MLNLGTTLRTRYRVDRMLEIGALEAQYGAWDLQDNRPVTIKELMPQPELDTEALEKLQVEFERDATALSALEHPHIVRVLDHFCATPEVATPREMPEAPNAYLVLEATGGQSLAELIEREGTIKERRIRPWAEQILGALAYAHTKGICHRDVKPENVLILPDNSVKLTNFEILALWNRSDPRTWTAKRVMGTPEYAPPERWGMRTTHIDPRSDIYSVGATLYHALTGEQPLTAGERTSNPYQFLQVKALSPRVSIATQTVILKAMALPRDKRYQTAEEMSEALRSHEVAGRSAGQAQPPPIFLPKTPRTFPWLPVLGLLVSTLVLTVAALIGLELGRRRAARRPEAMPLVASPEPTTAVATPGLEGAGVAEDIVVATAQPTGTATTNDGIPTTTSPPPLTPIPDTTVVEVGPSPPATWRPMIQDAFEDNANQWLVSEYEDDWGSTSREISAGTYRWRINADQPVGRWCTPELNGDDPNLDDFFVSVEAQRVSGPETAAYGLILRHVEGSYYLFSVRDDGYYQFSLWSGFDWQTVIDWTQTVLVRTGGVNTLTALARDGEFEFYINDEFIANVEENRITAGEVGLSISTAATDGEALFVFDNFRLWRP